MTQAAARTGQHATHAVAPSAKRGQARCAVDVSAGNIIIMRRLMRMRVSTTKLHSLITL